MDNIALIDHGTLAAAHSVLHAGRTPFYVGNTDVAIGCLSSLLESIVLFDELVLPGVPHGFSRQLSTSFGDAIRLRPIDGDVWFELERDAGDWVCDRVDIRSALDFSDLNLNGRHVVGSTELGIAAALSAVSDDSTEGLTFMFTPYAKRDALEQPRGWTQSADPSRKLIERLRTIHAADYKEVFQNENPRPMFMSLDLRNTYWAVFRSRCYDLVAQMWSLPYIPHPLRARAALGVRGLALGSAASPNVFLELLRETYDEGRRYVQNKTGYWIEPFSMSPLLPYILSKADTKERVLEVAYDVRDSRGARRLRERLAVLREPQSLEQRLALVRELNELKRMLDAELGIKETQQSITLSIAGLATTLPIPPTLARLAERLGTRSLRSDLVFLRNIYRDMAQAASLGAAYERLTQRTDSDNGLAFTEEDLKAKAQYFHAMLLNSGNDEEGSRRMVFGLLRQLTNRPAMEIKRLVEAALYG